MGCGLNQWVAGCRLAAESASLIGTSQPGIVRRRPVACTRTRGRTPTLPSPPGRDLGIAGEGVSVGVLDSADYFPFSASAATCILMILSGLLTVPLRA